MSSILNGNASGSTSASAPFFFFLFCASPSTDDAACSCCNFFATDLLPLPMARTPSHVGRDVNARARDSTDTMRTKSGNRDLCRC